MKAFVRRFRFAAVHHAHGFFQVPKRRWGHVERRQSGRLRFDNGTYARQLKRFDFGECRQCIGETRANIDARARLDGDMALRLKRDRGLADGRTRHAQPLSQFALPWQTAARGKFTGFD